MNSVSHFIKWGALHQGFEYRHSPRSRTALVDNVRLRRHFPRKYPEENLRVRRVTTDGCELCPEPRDRVHVLGVGL